MEPSFDRLFTLTEANQTLEKLRPIVADLIQARARLLEMQPELAPVLQKMLGNGGSRLTAELLGTFERLSLMRGRSRLWACCSRTWRPGCSTSPPSETARSSFFAGAMTNRR